MKFNEIEGGTKKPWEEMDTAGCRISGWIFFAIVSEFSLLLKMLLFTNYYNSLFLVCL
jgi:hypothetical protein